MKSAVRQIEEWVNNTVDWDKVSLNMKLILKTGVDSTVDELIRKYTELPALLKKLVTREVRKQLPPHIYFFLIFSNCHIAKHDPKLIVSD